MPDNSMLFATIVAFAFDAPRAFAVLVLIGLGLGALIGRFFSHTTSFLRAEALEISYTQSLKDSYIIRRVVENTSDGLVVQCMSGRIIWANPSYCQMIGYRPEDIVGRNPVDFLMPNDHVASRESIDHFEYDPNDPKQSGLQLRRNKRANGEEFWNQLNVSFRTAPDGTDHAIVSCRDVTEQVERERELEIVHKKLKHMVGHDDMTGIANRTSLMTFTDKALARAEQTGEPVGMIRIDLDRFKDINDTYGHAAGDAVLIKMAEVYRAKLRDTDLVARIGGDEFVAVCTDVNSLEALSTIAANLGRAGGRPFEFDGVTLRCSASFGVALSSPQTTTSEDLLLQSDFALYETKRLGRGRVTPYGPALHHRHLLHSHRRRELADALRHNQLAFHFQPTLSLANGQVTGFETLVRWDHPVEGLITPDAILPMAEELGLMAELDIAAMRAGIEMKCALRDAGHPNLHIGLNASASGLTDPSYFSTLQELVADHNLSSYHICIEVLETVMFDNTANASRHRAAISQLHKAGFQTLLDDFGIGHAGLSHLAKLDLAGVKIDRSLVSQVLVDAVSHRIVTTIAALCNDLDLWLIAEGVEDEAIAACLRDMGIGVTQGYWISKPLPRAQVIDWLTSYRIAPLPLGPTTLDTAKALPRPTPNTKKDLAS